MVHHAALFAFTAIGVRPVSGAFGRVKALHHKGIAAPAQHALLHAADFLRPIVLVKLFKPQDADIPERRLDRFELARIVKAEKKDRLTGRLIYHLHRVHTAVKLLVQPQGGNSPAHLRVNAGTQRRLHLADHCRMALPVGKQLQKHLHRSKGAFGAAASAAQYHFAYPPRTDGPVQRVKRRRYHAAKRCRQ